MWVEAVPDSDLKLLADALVEMTAERPEGWGGDALARGQALRDQVEAELERRPGEQPTTVIEIPKPYDWQAEGAFDEDGD